MPLYAGRRLFVWDLAETLCPLISDPDRIENASFVKRLWLTGVRVCVRGAQESGWGAQHRGDIHFSKKKKKFGDSRSLLLSFSILPLPVWASGL